MNFNRGEIMSIKQFSLLALVIILSTQAQAMRYMGANGSGMTTNDPHRTAHLGTRAAACAPAQARADLEWNNVRAKIETGGSMWQDRATSRAAYEVPKDGGVSSIYSGALWMGGESPDGQLKLAAVTFRADGNDYWPGPLTNDGTAEVSDAVCTEYDKFFISLRQDAQLHRAYFDCIASGEGDCESYQTPAYFNNYPAQGNPSLGQDFYLAPFYDYDGDLLYDPSQGDYPWYDFLKEIDCRTRTRESVVPLFGDQTYYWIFNDKGNVHSESLGQPIGMEIRAQAFAFTTNDEINNMTFYNYVLINQGSQTLTNTYFGSWVDPDLGNSTDDYVGCDVQRGLGYCYNGDNTDEAGPGTNGYGANPPAVGVDFFEGPYQDADDVDNPLTEDIAVAQAEGGIPYKGLGIGYGDGIVDNERFGMRRFVYYNIGTNPINGDPDNAPDFYNYMRGIWKNGQTMLYGGTGVSGNTGVTTVEAGYMFPRDTDPVNWGTNGIPMPTWSEETSNNPSGDRRFIQSAGPFTLEPGDYNNITVGVVWARSFQGDARASVNLLKDADDKAQALFDNCFELVSGPDAPDVSVRELENELILMLSNENTISNNYLEGYSEFDASIPEAINSLGLTFTEAQRSYAFEGYLVYQLANAEVGPEELEDPSKARIIFETDVANGVSDIVNYEFQAATELIVPTLKVNGADEGITRSIRITTDAFAQGQNTLINHKTYYFMAIAYGYNNYLEYNPVSRNGQSRAFISSRKAASGEIPVITGIPRAPMNGIVQNAAYGQGIPLTQIEGQGSGNLFTFFNPETEATILEDGVDLTPTYIGGASPVSVIVIDPLRVQDAEWELKLTGDTDFNETNPDSLFWQLTNLTNGDVIPHYKSFRVASEDVILDYGIAVNWGEYLSPVVSDEYPADIPEIISSEITYSDAGRPWLFGIPDEDGQSSFNWIRSGSDGVDAEGTFDENLYADYNLNYLNNLGTDLPAADPDQIFEDVIFGTWAPYALASYSQSNSVDNVTTYANNAAPLLGLISMTNYNRSSTDPIGSVWQSTPLAITNTARPMARLDRLNSIDVVFTSDKSKWTRCPVLEMQSDPTLAQGFSASDRFVKNQLRRAPSVDKNGRRAGQEGYNDADGTLNGLQPTGMGWFPGYAIDIHTGERLNMAFGEDSWLASENGRDMIWNPTSNFTSPDGTQNFFGGQHWIYVFRNAAFEQIPSSGLTLMPRYDQGQTFYNIASTTNFNGALTPTSGGLTAYKTLWASCSWIGSAIKINDQVPFLSVEQGLIPNEARVSIRVSRPYKRWSSTSATLNNPEQNGATNGWRNLYRFTTKGFNPTILTGEALEDELNEINVVPNPYYAFSTYETGKLDNRVKITNLPQTCTISIFDMNGTRVRQFRKADPTTSLDWDLKNEKNIPIASGTYIIHIEVPGVGEKILKWFGVMRPVDLDRF